MASDKVQELSDAAFDTVVKSEIPTLVDFWAPWCGPCKAIGPVIEDLAVEYEGKVTIAKMNVDDNPATPGKFGIRAIPTLILFKDGQVVDQITGSVGKTQLVALIEKAN
jgi:thioredoxin 1